MKNFYTLFIVLIVAFSTKAQNTTIDLSTIDAAYKTTFDNETVVDVATCASTIASPSLSITNPFKDQSFEEATIQFDVYNYDAQKVLGCLLSFYDATYGRIYFTNGSYLGYNDHGYYGGSGSEHYFDANMKSYGQDVDFLGSSTWKTVQMTFTNSGYSVTVDNTLSFNQSSTDVTINSERLTDYSEVITFLQKAESFVIGTGSWWSDNYDTSTGAFYDPQYSYLKNISFSYTAPTAIDTPISVDNGLVVSTEYYTISGTKASSNYNELGTGIYIKKDTYESGKVKTTKIFKERR